MALHDALAMGQCFSEAWELEAPPPPPPPPAAAAAAGGGTAEGVGGEQLEGWRLSAALARYESRRVGEVRRVVLASRHYGRLRSRMLPEAESLLYTPSLLADPSGGGEGEGGEGGEGGRLRLWESVSVDEYEAAVLASGLARPLQAQLMPAVADPLLSVSLAGPPLL